MNLTSRRLAAAGLAAGAALMLGALATGAAASPLGLQPESSTDGPGPAPEPDPATDPQPDPQPAPTTTTPTSTADANQDAPADDVTTSGVAAIDVQVVEPDAGIILWTGEADWTVPAPLEYVVTNTGDTTLTGILLTDTSGATITCPGTTLATGEDMTCTGEGVLFTAP